MKKECGAVDAATDTKAIDNNESVALINKSFDDRAVIDEARQILKTENPIEYILKTFNDIHKGDTRTGEVLALSVGSTCVENCAGLHPKLSGKSGKGKSHSCKTMIHLIPREYVLNTSLSAKAMFYHGGTMQDGMIIFSDDIELSSDLESIIKRSTSEFQQGIEHHTVGIDRKGQVLRMPKRIVWWLASVDNDFDLQTLNRQIGVSVDDSKEIDDEVMDQQLQASGEGTIEYPETFQVQVCREIYRTIKQLFVRVVVPFYNRIEWRGSKNRRNLPIFLDMVKVYALFNYQQRTHRRADDERCEILATEDDYRNAAALYIDRAQTQTNKLNEHEAKIIDFIASYGIADVNTISNAVGGSYRSTLRALEGRKERGTGGLLDKVKELRVVDVVRELDGGQVRCKEFSLEGYNVLGSYESIVSLKPE